MNWRIAVIPVTMIPIFIIVIQFDIKLEDVLAIGILPFIAAVLAMMVKLGLQGLKLSYIARSFLGNFDSIKRLTAMRIGSEFIKFTTLLSILAGIFALLNGAYVVATIILATSISVTTLWVVLFFLSAKHTFHLPGGIAMLLTKFGGERGGKYAKQTNEWIEEVCMMSRQNLGSNKSRKVFCVGFLMSLVSWIFYGISFLIIAISVGFALGFFESIMAVMGANAIGNLPITIGGSGLAEFGIVAYLNNLNPFNLVIPEEGLEWNAVIGWRIATYYIPIAVTWVLLVKLALGRYTKPKTISDKCPVCGDMINESEFASHVQNKHPDE